MINIFKTFAITFVIGIMIFSCKKDNDKSSDVGGTTSGVNSDTLLPVIVYFYSSVPNAGGMEKIVISYQVKRGSSDISKVTMEQSLDESPTFTLVNGFDSSLISTTQGFSVSKYYYLPTSLEYSNITLKLTIVDSKGRLITKSVYLTLINFNYPAFFSNIELGYQYSKNMTCFFSTSEQIVYGGLDAQKNSAKIDFCFLNNSNFDAVISSPSDKIVEGEYYRLSNTERDPKNWSSRNITYFKKSRINYISSEERVYTLKERWISNSNAKSTKISNFVPDMVFDFITQSGKYGIFRVEKVENTKITISGLVAP